MKSFGKLAVCMAGGLILAPALWADDAAAPDSNPLPNNPYAPIVVRNVFNLNPPDAAAAPTEADPPMKITPQGIQDFWGTVKALFKVGGIARPGQPAQDKYYMLAEGERKDDIEVKHIDQKNRIITFDNHGQLQELPLVAGQATGPAGGTPLPGGNPGFQPNNGENGNGNPGRGFGRFGQRGGFRGGSPQPNPNPGNPEASSASGNGTDLNLRSIPTRIYQPEAPPSDLTPEQQAILIEAQRAKYMSEGNKAAPLLPPTPLTDQ